MIRPVQHTTLPRMRATAAAEAGRIEIIQQWLVESGLRDQPSEQQLQMRDDFDAIIRLIDVVVADRTVLKRIVRLMKR